MSNWVITLTDDLKTVSKERACEITQLVLSNLVVVIRNQCLTAQDEIDFVSKCGVYQRTHGNERGKNIIIPEVDGVLRVTGKKNDNGEEGLFGHVDALDWHANQTSNPDRMPLIWLYGVEGTQGSRTSWINMIKAYEDLSCDFKKDIQDIKVYCGYKKGLYSTSDYFKEHVNRNYAIPLVKTTNTGQTGLYFPFLQIFEFEGNRNKDFNRIMNTLKDHVLQDKYVYHHDWQDKDVVLSEQWLSIHKRWKFEKMEDRVLHRIAYRNVV
jgi:alpha-ketoglutarate-dependent taurine dioxygenase